MTYPPTKRDDIVVRIHGRELADPYRWLEETDDPEVREWVKLQNEVGRAYLDRLPSREFFRRQVESQFRHGLISLPMIRGESTFLVWRRPDDQHLKLYWRAADDDEWQALVDPEALDSELLTTLDDAQVSADGRLVAYLLSRGGDEISMLHVLDVATREEVVEPIDRCHALATALTWKPDSSGFFYSRSLMPSFRDPSPYPGAAWRLYEHDLATGVSADRELFGAEAAQTAAIRTVVSPDGNTLIIESHDMMPATPVEVYRVDLTDDTRALHPLWVGSGAEHHCVFAPDNTLYARTFHQASRGRVVRLDLESRNEEPEEIVPEHDVAVLKQFVVLGDALVVNSAEEDISSLTVHDRRTGSMIGRVSLPGEGTIGGPGTAPADDRTIWFAYSDFTTPGGVWCWRRGDDRATPWLLPEQRHGRDVTVRRVDFPSHDGVLVPMVIFHRGEITDPRPAIVYAYGGFGFSVLRPAFDHWATAWTAAGGVYAIVGARGGGERGEAWHRAGTRENKFNTYEDFNAAARWLVANGYTTHQQVAAGGVSQGALSVAAAVCRDPGNWAAAVSCAMGTDLLRPLHEGGGWAEEYGDGTDPTEFEWLLRDSPYHNVHQGTCYPATLVCAFGQDTRTVPSEGHKWVALLQWAMGCDRPVILRHEEDAGHSTRSVRSMVELLADWLAFVAANTGLEVT